MDYELLSVLFIRLQFSLNKTNEFLVRLYFTTTSGQLLCAHPVQVSHTTLAGNTWLFISRRSRSTKAEKSSNKRIMKWSTCHFAQHVSTRWARTTRPTSMQISSVQSRVICQADEWANLFPSRLSVIEAAYLYSGDARRDRPAVRTASVAAIFDCTTWTSPPDQTWGGSVAGLHL